MADPEARQEDLVSWVEARNSLEVRSIDLVAAPAQIAERYTPTIWVQCLVGQVGVQTTS